MKKTKDMKKPEELFRKQLERKSILLCKKVLAKHNLCNNCLGRQFAQLSTGMTNAQRGKIVREVVGDVAKSKSDCFICHGFFSSMNSMLDEAVRKLKPYEYETFVVGTKTGKKIVKSEEEIWEETGIEHCEPFRSESNREFGKALYTLIKKEVDEENPNIMVTLNMEDGRVDVEPRSVFVYGLYKKLVRGIPQTKWDMYPVTVEDIIAKPFMATLKTDKHSLHCAGREDIDARCLDWRPFVLEMEQPMRRNADLKAMTIAINKTGKVEVSGLRPSDKNEVRAVKEIRPDKEYRMLVEFESRPDDKKISQLTKLIGPIKQQTPTRVMHRRADLLRHKRVKTIKWRKVRAASQPSPKDSGVSRLRTRNTAARYLYEIQIRGDAGLYAKEFVHGDDGRTKPSVAEFLGVGAKVLELDVVKIYL